MNEAVLLVEDDEPIRRFTETILKQEGYAVLVACHSDEALILLDSYSGVVDLLITDVQMDPFMDGCELAKCVRLMRPETRVLYISGFSAHPMVIEEVQEGRAIFLMKPFKISDLLVGVQNAMDRSHHSV
jgi:two-component system, cell cycle sensor histidine kinase and response regulator CckA